MGVPPGPDSRHDWVVHEPKVLSSQLPLEHAGLRCLSPLKGIDLVFNLVHV